MGTRTEIYYLRTNGENEDFASLCRELDQYLNDLVGGEENRMEYVPHNKLDDIHHVVVAYDKDRPVGCASIKDQGENTAEVKRVFVKEAYRGTGISEELMRGVEQLAAEKNYIRLILETGKVLEAAVGLYSKLGYQVIPNYGPYVDMEESVCMGKMLIQ